MSAAVTRLALSKLILGAACAIACSGVMAAAKTDTAVVADIVYNNGNIHTIDTFHSTAEAVAIKDGKFIKIGSDEDMKAVTGTIDKMAERFATREKRGPVSDLINPDGVKIYADGVWLGYGSPFIDMYETGETYGRQSIDQPTMKTWVTRFDKEGLKVMIHAVGDQAVRNALNAFKVARQANGPGGPRHHLGHNTFVHPEDRARAAELNIVSEVSPEQ